MTGMDVDVDIDIGVQRRSLPGHALLWNTRSRSSALYYSEVFAIQGCLCNGAREERYHINIRI